MLRSYATPHVVPQLVLGDLVVVWRLYVVWGKNAWIVIFPLIMIAGEFSE